MLDRGRLVLQEDLAALRAPTGRTVVETSDVERALGVLDGTVEHQDGDRLLVRAPDPAELNHRLVQAGVRVRTLGAERRTLEEIIAERTSARGPDEVPR
jgi:ABC-2 type transport system ATP-binding protein